MKTIALLLCLGALSVRSAEPTNTVVVAKPAPATNAPALSPLAALDLQIAQLDALQEKTWRERSALLARISIASDAKKNTARAQARANAMAEQARAQNAAALELEVKRLAFAPNDDVRKRASDRHARMDAALHGRTK